MVCSCAVLTHYPGPGTRFVFLVETTPNHNIYVSNLYISLNCIVLHYQSWNSSPSPSLCSQPLVSMLDSWSRMRTKLSSSPSRNQNAWLSFQRENSNGWPKLRHGPSEAYQFPKTCLFQNVSNQLTERSLLHGHHRPPRPWKHSWSPGTRN